VSGLFDFSIRTSTGSYKVAIGTDIIGPHRQQDQTVWIVDAGVARLYTEVVPSSFIAQVALEPEKSLASVARIIEQLRKHGTNRESHVVAVGGGIIQDLVTFAASCYMRGITWTYYPTTMLSMVDSCIGGKSSINVGNLKNIAGNFYPPHQVIIDTRFCETLTDEQMAEGFCEAAKICYADSDDTFDTFLELAEGCAMPYRIERIARLIQHSLWTKKHFIEEDEFDQGIRLLLNFGHCFGHALEGSTSFAISHGTAVGLGMLAAENISIKLGFAKDDLANVFKLTTYVRQLLRSVPGLADKLRKMSPAAAVDCFMADKKHTADFFTLILLDHEGRLQRVKVPKSDPVRAQLLSTFQYLKELADEIQ